MIITRNLPNNLSNPEDIERIEYLDLNLETKKEFDNLYRTLCKDEMFQKFINTGIYGKIGETRFVIYKSREENNKICIAFIKKRKKYIVCMNSITKGYETSVNNQKAVNVKKYIDECCYYSITENEKIRHRETTGLNSLSKKNYKISWMNYNKKYQIQLLQENECYKYEIKVMENSGDITITCIWDKYEDFDNEIEPKKVTLKIYQNEPIIGTYEEIESLAPNYGLSLKNDRIREYLRTGEYVDPIVPRILNDFYEIEKIRGRREKIIQLINKNPVSKVHYNEDAIQETRHLSKRYALEQKNNRP